MIPDLSHWQIATILAGGVCTLAIFSFLVRENPFFRIFEHLFIGLAAALGIAVTLKNFLWPKIVSPLFGLDLQRYPDGTLSAPYNYWYLLYLVPLGFGLLYYLIYSRRYNWMAKIVIGLTLGASGGLAFEGFFNQMLPQLESSFKPLLVASQQRIDWAASANNFIFVITLLAVMYYFFFSFRRRGAASTTFAASGRWLMMICFGAYFGSTVMARMALLVERIQFLVGNFRVALLQLVGW